MKKVQNRSPFTSLINNLWLCITICLVVFLSIGCTTSGYFTSNPKGRASFAGTEFILTKNDSFQINRWTDVYAIRIDSEGNRIWDTSTYRGRGVYEKIKDSLILRFTNVDSLTVRIVKNQNSTESEYDISFFDELHRPANMSFNITNENDKILHDVFMPMKNAYNFSFLRNVGPLYLKLKGFSGLSVEKTMLRIDTLSFGVNTIRLKTHDGYYPKDEVVKIWFKTTYTGIRFRMNGRKRYLPKRWKWKFLNGFYKDY